MSRAKPVIAIKRVYEPPAKADGKRLLVERLWPRGIRKESLRLDGWLRDVAPSTPLRKWFGHDPKRWDAFRRRYEDELEGNATAWEPILAAAKEGPVTLLFSSRDAEHNNVVALRDFLESKMGRVQRASPRSPSRRRA